MNSPELDQYLSAARAAGQSDETIRSQLLAAGWSFDVVETALGNTSSPAGEIRTGRPAWFYALLPYYLPIGLFGVLAPVIVTSLTSPMGIFGGALNLFIVLVMLLVVVGTGKLLRAKGPLFKKTLTFYGLNLIVTSVIGALIAWYLSLVPIPDIIFPFVAFAALAYVIYLIYLIHLIYELSWWRVVVWIVLQIAFIFGAFFLIAVAPFLFMFL
jgi:hypothetical protein